MGTPLSHQLKQLSPERRHKIYQRTQQLIAEVLAVSPDRPPVILSELQVIDTAESEVNCKEID